MSFRAVRGELSILGSEVFGGRPDPNRMTVEWLQRNAAPSDEILINYEDLPLAFYLPRTMRRSVDFVHAPVFERELARYRWDEQNVKIPEIIWGNSPDPMMWQNYPADITYWYLARRVDGGNH